ETIAQPAPEGPSAARIQEIVPDPSAESDFLEVVAEILAPLAEHLGFGLPRRARDDPRLAVHEVDTPELLDRLAADGSLDPDAEAAGGPEEVVVPELDVPPHPYGGVITSAQLQMPGLLLGYGHVDVGEGRRSGPERIDAHG